MMTTPPTTSMPLPSFGLHFRDIPLMSNRRQTDVKSDLLQLPTVSNISSTTTGSHRHHASCMCCEHLLPHAHKHHAEVMPRPIDDLHRTSRSYQFKLTFLSFMAGARPWFSEHLWVLSCSGHQSDVQDVQHIHDDPRCPARMYCILTPPTD
jgi:hypothetical protein